MTVPYMNGEMVLGTNSQNKYETYSFFKSFESSRSELKENTPDWWKLSLLKRKTPMTMFIVKFYEKSKIRKVN